MAKDKSVVTSETTNKVDFVSHTYLQHTEDKCVVCNRPMRLSGNYYKLNGQPIEKGCLKQVRKHGSIQKYLEWFRNESITKMGLDPSKVSIKANKADETLMTDF